MDGRSEVVNMWIVIVIALGVIGWLIACWHEQSEEDKRLRDELSRIARKEEEKWNSF